MTSPCPSNNFPPEKKYWNRENLCEARSSFNVKWISLLLRHAWNPLRALDPGENSQRITRWNRWISMKDLMEELFSDSIGKGILSCVIENEISFFETLYNNFKDIRAMFYIHVREQYELCRILRMFMNGGAITEEINNGIEFVYLYSLMRLVERKAKSSIIIQLENIINALQVNKRYGIKTCNNWYTQKEFIFFKKHLRQVESVLQLKFLEKLDRLALENKEMSDDFKRSYSYMKYWSRHLFCGMVMNP